MVFAYRKIIKVRNGDVVEVLCVLEIKNVFIDVTYRDLVMDIEGAVFVDGLVRFPLQLLYIKMKRGQIRSHCACYSRGLGTLKRCSASIGASYTTSRG